MTRSNLFTEALKLDTTKTEREIKKCKEFFGEVAQEVTSGKPQATSGEQVTNIKNYDIIKTERKI